MKKIIANIFGNSGFSSFLASTIAIILGLTVGLLVMFVFNPQGAWPGFLTMLQGGFSDGARGVGQVLFYTTSLIFAGLSVGFSFQTGLFNIGVIGQFSIAAYVAIIIGGKIAMPASVHWIVAVLAAGVAGLLWAAIPGILKAYFNVSEIITTIMMNYIALYLVNQLIYTTHLEVSTQMSKDIYPTALMPKVGFDRLFSGSSVNVGIFIALAFAIVVYIILFKTSYGYSLRCCGLNRDASHYAGINETRNILSVMLIAGFIAGIGGGILYLSALSKNYKIAELFISEPGYGIPVALLGISNPVGIVFSSLFLSYIIIGGSLMQGFGFPVETVGMITAVIIYFAAFALIFKGIVNRIGLQLSMTGVKKTRTLKDE
jgi:general nucleoside transport system permease protein